MQSNCSVLPPSKSDARKVPDPPRSDTVVWAHGLIFTSPGWAHALAVLDALRALWTSLWGNPRPCRRRRSAPARILLVAPLGLLAPSRAATLATPAAA